MNYVLLYYQILRLLNFDSLFKFSKHMRTCQNEFLSLFAGHLDGQSKYKQKDKMCYFCELFLTSSPTQLEKCIL